MKNPYEVLGINQNADKDEIKKAYRVLAKKYHPDTNRDNQEAEARFNEVHNAYLILTDDEKRTALNHELNKNTSSNKNKKVNDFDSIFMPKGRKPKTQMNYQNTNQQFSDFFGFNPKGKKS